MTPDTGGLIDLACANAANLKWGIALVGAHFGCKAVTIFTNTPDPTTKLGKVYRIIEIGAGLLGKAKQSFDKR